MSSRRPGRDGEAELLLDLAGRGELRRLADLDDAAGQVPVLLVGQLAQQHPAVLVAQQHLADGALAGQERVQQRPEGHRLAERRVVAEPGQHDVLAGLGALAGAAPHPADALLAQARAGRDAQRRLVAGLDARLDPAQAEAALPGLGERPVGEHAHRAGGPAVAALPREQPPGQVPGVRVAGARLVPAHLDGAHRGALDVDHEAEPGTRRVLAPALLEHLELLLVRRGAVAAEPVADPVVVPLHGPRHVVLAPRPQRDGPVAQGRLLGGFGGHGCTLAKRSPGWRGWLGARLVHHGMQTNRLFPR